jgi:hypothetical protein
VRLARRWSNPRAVDDETPTLTAVVDVQRELADLSDEVWQRTRARLEGLTDDEYFWAPTPGCWTVRQRADGTWVADLALPPPDPAPFTTIAWRLWHLIDMYGEDRAPRWLDVPPQGTPIGLDDPEGAPPATAAEAVALLERAHDRWEAHLALADDECLAQPVGSVAGPEYADRSRAAYVLHMLDEFVHHGAEVAQLRDLWRWQCTTIIDDPTVESIVRGDPAVVRDLDLERAPSELVDRAASYARWDLLIDLVQRGAPVGTTGRTALHLAAGAGELDAVKVLLEHGADPNAIDPDYHATPQQWAAFLRHPTVVAYLRALPDEG